MEFGEKPAAAQAKQTSTTIVCCNGIALIFYGIVIGNISKEQFEIVFAPLGIHYYNFMLTTFICNIIQVFFACCICSTVKGDESELSGPQKAMTGLQNLVGCVALILQYVFLAQLWSEDPEHTICFNDPFWNTQARSSADIYGKDFGAVAIGDEGAYELAEILLRMGAFGLMMAPVFVACCCCCLVPLAAMMKK